MRTEENSRDKSRTLHKKREKKSVENRSNKNIYMQKVSFSHTYTHSLFLFLHLFTLPLSLSLPVHVYLLLSFPTPSLHTASLHTPSISLHILSIQVMGILANMTILDLPNNSSWAKLIRVRTRQGSIGQGLIVLECSTLFYYSAMFCPVLFVLFCSVLFSSVLFYFVLERTTVLFYSTIPLSHTNKK